MLQAKRIAALALAAALCCLPAGAGRAAAAGGQETVPAAAQPQQGGRFALPSFDVPAKEAVLVALDTGDLLYAKAPDARVPIASITKVMTLLLTFEAVDSGRVKLSDPVPVSAHAYSMGGSQIWLEPGERFTLDEMIRAICISSANDAAVAVAEFIGGSEPVFAQRMTARARELGMQNTSFVNACGLDTEGHFSTARDVAIMSRELLTRHPDITRYTTIWTDSLRGGATQLTNTNKLLRSYQGITGLKTGTTGGAGVCIAASAERGGLPLLAVVLGSASSAERFAAAAALLDYGFANFEESGLPDLSAHPQRLPVTGGAENAVGLCYPPAQKLLLKKGEGAALSAAVALPKSLPAPVAAGARVGTVTLAVGGEQLGSWPITAAGSVAKMTFEIAFGRLLGALTRL